MKVSGRTGLCKKKVVEGSTDKSILEIRLIKKQKRYQA